MPFPGMENRGGRVWQGREEGGDNETSYAHCDFEVFVGVSCGNDCKSNRCLGLELRRGISIRCKDLGINKKQMRKTWPGK